MPSLAIAGARELLDGPATARRTTSPTRRRSLRALVKYERWKELLDDKAIGWRDTLGDKVHRHYVEALAHIGLGNLDKAVKSMADHTRPRRGGAQAREQLAGSGLHRQRARAEGPSGAGPGRDPERHRLPQRGAPESRRASTTSTAIRPNTRTSCGRCWGGPICEARSPALAVTAFERSLTISRNDGFALAGLVEAHAALGDRTKAAAAMARLLHVWSDAEPGNRWLERARATGVTAAPRDVSPAAQRSYKKATLASSGPATWQPYPAPALDALDATRKRVTLERVQGQERAPRLLPGRGVPPLPRSAARG